MSIFPRCSIQVRSEQPFLSEFVAVRQLCEMNNVPWSGLVWQLLENRGRIVVLNHINGEFQVHVRREILDIVEPLRSI